MATSTRGKVLSLLKKTRRRLSIAQPSDNYRLADFSDGLLDRLTKATKKAGHSSPPIAIVAHREKTYVVLTKPGENRLGSLHLIKWSKGKSVNPKRNPVGHPIEFYARITPAEMQSLRRAAIAVVESWIDFASENRDHRRLMELGGRFPVRRAGGG